MLITDLSEVKGLQIVERIKLQALVEEMGLGASGLVEANTAPRVGKLLGAQWLIGGDILDGKLYITT
jgi:curli biogenesis system outer membrane secretion channel CsgG